MLGRYERRITADPPRDCMSSIRVKWVASYEIEWHCGIEVDVVL
jgi:hypothetical protein